MCAQVKNLFKFRRIFLLLLSAFELIWKLFPSTEPFWWFGKNPIFLECSLSYDNISGLHKEYVDHVGVCFSNSARSGFEAESVVIARD